MTTTYRDLPGADVRPGSPRHRGHDRDAVRGPVGDWSGILRDNLHAAAHVGPAYAVFGGHADDRTDARRPVVLVLGRFDPSSVTAIGSVGLALAGHPGGR
jgi:hypothetical protein